MTVEASTTPVHRKACIAIVDGEGVGAEVTAAALTVLDAMNAALGASIEVRRSTHRNSFDEYGMQLDESTGEFLESLLGQGVPVLHGPAGGRYVYDLRERFDLHTKLVPVRPLPALLDASVVRPERLRNVDLLIVRDNIGGFYQGAFGSRDGGAVVYQEAAYSEAQVTRVLELAVSQALDRRGRLAVVVKPGGVPTISRLWRQCAEHVVPSTVDMEFIEIDNACYQVVADPGRFDVIATPNMFGDVLGDTAAVLLGSRGMSFSANFGANGKAVYQTAHGAARDLAGRGTANPVAHILTMAWMLRESLGFHAAAAAIEASVSEVLGAGLRTPDIAGPTSQVLGTQELAAAIAERLSSGASVHGLR